MNFFFANPLVLLFFHYFILVRLIIFNVDANLLDWKKMPFRLLEKQKWNAAEKNHDVIKKNCKTILKNFKKSRFHFYRVPFVFETIANVFAVQFNMLGTKFLMFLLIVGLHGFFYFILMFAMLLVENTLQLIKIFAVPWRLKNNEKCESCYLNSIIDAHFNAFQILLL